MPIRGAGMSVDHSNVSPVVPDRKRWETPTVILGTARSNTLSTVNTLGPDGVASTGSGYGS